MGVKLKGTLNNFYLTKGGEFKIVFLIPLNFLSECLSLLEFLEKFFSVKIKTEGFKDCIIEKAYLYRIMIDKQGESKVVIAFSSQYPGDINIFGRCQAKLLEIDFKEKS